MTALRASPGKDWERNMVEEFEELSVELLDFSLMAGLRASLEEELGLSIAKNHRVDELGFPQRAGLTPFPYEEWELELTVVEESEAHLMAELGCS